MKAIYIPQLIQAPEQTELIEANEFLPGLETLTPVQGQVQVSHRGNYLEVSAQVETIITLTCDRCLQQYNHRLVSSASELIWLKHLPQSSALERETRVDELVEVLPPQGYFAADVWLYEQLCLTIPLRQLCDQHCPGITAADTGATSGFDHRWAALAALKQPQPGE